MELAVKVLFGIYILVVGSLVVGFISAWWEKREREKNKRDNGDGKYHKKEVQR